MTNGAIRYELRGGDLQLAEVTLDPGGSLLGEAGYLVSTAGGITMESVRADGRQTGMGGVAFGGRAAGETLFATLFANGSQRAQRLAFAAPWPGRVVVLDLLGVGGALCCRKEAFLCAAPDVALRMQVQQDTGTVLHALAGEGLVFLHAGGTDESRPLAAGEQLLVAAGCLLAFTPGVTQSAVAVSPMTWKLGAGAAPPLTRLEGPGTVWLQSLPWARVVERALGEARLLPGSRPGHPFDAPGEAGP